MRVHRKYKVCDANGLVCVSNCSAGLTGDIRRITDTEYNMIRIAAILKNSDNSIDTSLLPAEATNEVYLEEEASE